MTGQVLFWGRGLANSSFLALGAALIICMLIYQIHTGSAQFKGYLWWIRYQKDMFVWLSISSEKKLPNWLSSSLLVCPQAKNASVICTHYSSRPPFLHLSLRLIHSWCFCAGSHLRWLRVSVPQSQPRSHTCFALGAINRIESRTAARTRTHPCSSIGAFFWCVRVCVCVWAGKNSLFFTDQPHGLFYCPEPLHQKAPD